MPFNPTGILFFVIKCSLLFSQGFKSRSIGVINAYTLSPVTSTLSNPVPVLGSYRYISNLWIPNPYLLQSVRAKRILGRDLKKTSQLRRYSQCPLSNYPDAGSH